MSALVMGCATRPLPEGPLASLQTLQGHTLSTNHQQVAGRFGLKASFLSEPIQGRFDWRKPRNGIGPELLELQNPWGELEAGLGRIRGATDQPTVITVEGNRVPEPGDRLLGWQIFDQRGRPVSEEALDRWAAGLGLDAKNMGAFLQLLHALEPRLTSLSNPQPVAERINTPGAWIELRLIADPCCN
jgi:hypothetical protein